MCTVLILAFGNGIGFSKACLCQSRLKHCMGKLAGVRIPPLVGLWYMGISISLYLPYLPLVFIKRHTVIKIIRYIINTHTGPLSGLSSFAGEVRRGYDCYFLLCLNASFLLGS